MRHAFLAAVLWAIPNALVAQQDSVRLIGTVTTFDSTPLAGVLLSLPSIGRSVTTDSTGRFEFANLRAGRHTLRIAAIGLAPTEYEVTLRSGHTVTLIVLVDPSAVELAPIVVLGEHQEGTLGITGFYARKLRAVYGGLFFTHADIVRRSPSTLSALLAGSGIVMRCGLVGGGCIPTRASRCVVPVFLNGARVPSQELDRIPTPQVAGVEVYRSSFDTPADYAFGSFGDCGAVLIWTGHS